MIKVMTMNINSYNTRFGPWPVRLGLIREAIENACPDVIALQFVGRNPGEYGGQDQAEQVAGLFTVYKHVHYQPAMELAGGVTEGIAFISRFPFAQVDELPLSLLSRTDDNTRRVLLHARFELDAGPLHVFNAYFSWVEDQARDNLREALPFLEKYSGPALLVGDFNTPPDSTVLETLREHGWTDVWATTYPEVDGFTFFEAGSLVKRIDYAWVNDPLRSSVKGIRLLAEGETGIDARPSDHVALLVTLNLPQQEGQPCSPAT